MNKIKGIEILFGVNILIFMCMEDFTEKKRPKQAVRLRGLYTILTKGGKLWRSDKTKKKGLGLCQ